MDMDWLTNIDWLKVSTIASAIFLFMIWGVLANIKNLLKEFNDRNKIRLNEIGFVFASQN